MINSKENFNDLNSANTSYLNLPVVNFEDRCDEFRVGKKSFQTQYFPYYNARVEIMSEMVKTKAKELWGEDIRFYELSELNDTEEGQKVCLVGVIFKYLEKHPSILKEVSEEYQLILPTEDKKFTSENDFVALQQGKDTIRLNGVINVDELVNGVMIAVMGFNQDEQNTFYVEEICFAGPISTIERPIPEKDQFIVLVSGLGFSKNMPLNLINSLDGLSDYLIGFNDENTAIESSQILKLIIAGNCVSKQARKTKEEDHLMNNLNNQWLANKKTKNEITDIMSIVDKWIFQIAKFIEVDIMPGEYDPASLLMPQQPLHIGLLPQCSVLKTVRCLTNPYSSKINGTYLLGCSGQTVDSIRSYSSFDDALDILKQKLIWSHLAPTAPDSLYSYPFLDRDPFIIKQCPHILFSGNQDHFNTLIFKDNNNQDIRLVSVPSFEDKLTCVLINLKNLKCDYMAFN